MICVTNKRLCKDDFFRRIRLIAQAGSAILLREKDLTAAEYLRLAIVCKQLCEEEGSMFIINHQIGVAQKLKVDNIHMSVSELRQIRHDLREFQNVGVSVHTAKEAIEAEQAGATYVIAGHIFETDCKKGVEGRGLLFLKQVCQSVKIPVYAIGGINHARVESIRLNGASGFCIMSELMTCDDPANTALSYQKKSDSLFL